MTREGFGEQTEHRLAIDLGASQCHRTLVPAFTPEQVRNLEAADPDKVRRFREAVEKFLRDELIIMASDADLAPDAANEHSEILAA